VSTDEFIIGLFVRVDEAMRDVPLQPQGLLYPREIVTLGVLSALTGGGQRAFDRGLTREYAALFPFLPQRTRLFRLLLAHHGWTRRFMAAPTVLGVADTYGIELVPPGGNTATRSPWARKDAPIIAGSSGPSAPSCSLSGAWSVGGRPMRPMCMTAAFTG
jgi:hypothetical protein